MKNNCIYIADTNVLRVPTLRRYLFGLSAMHNVNLGIPPALLVDSELPVNLVLSAGDQVRSKLKVSDKKWNGLFAKHFTDVLKQSRGWIADGFDRDIFKRLDSPPTSESDRIMGEIGTFFKPRVLNPDGTNEYLNHDMNMVVQSVANDADAIVTNNISTINHDELNHWYSQKTGSNEKFLCSVSDLSGRHCEEAQVELAIVGAMAVSDSDRSEDKQIASIRLFLGNLDFNGEIDLSLRARRLFKEMDPIEHTRLVEQTVDLAASPRFRNVRDFNHTLVSISQRLEQDVIDELNLGGDQSL